MAAINRPSTGIAKPKPAQAAKPPAAKAAAKALRFGMPPKTTNKGSK